MNDIQTQHTLFVSPSGHFYGSEQVLYNFLSNTSEIYMVFVPKASLLQEKLMSLGKHQVKGFTSIKRLYFKLFWKLVAGSYHTVYVNEGGHIKYVKLLAKCFKNKRFLLHIRLTEDCDSQRLGKLPGNVMLISISKFIRKRLEPYPSYCIYDPLDIQDMKIRVQSGHKSKYRIGIIGRVSISKGLWYYQQFFEYLESKPINLTMEFEFYGDILDQEPEANQFYKFCQDSSLPITFMGFEQDQDKIYKHLDLVLHLNPNEPLGRIGLESWARGIPFIGFDEGGAGEINSVLGLQEYSIQRNKDWPRLLESKLQSIIETKNLKPLQEARKGVAANFGVKRYITELEQLFKKN